MSARSPSPVGDLSKRLQSLSGVLIASVCIALLVPAIVGSVILWQLGDREVARELDRRLDNQLGLLSEALVEPAWNLDSSAAMAVVRGAMKDQTLVRATVIEGESRLLARYEYPERRLGTAYLGEREIRQGERVIGKVSLEFDDGLQRREHTERQRVYFAVLLAQVLLAGLLILWVVGKRVLQPLRRLRHFSDQIAAGNLASALDWQHPDEIGKLAAQLESMRANLQKSFAEEQLVLDNVPVGVLFVRDRVIRVCNLQAETLFGYAPEEMVDQPVDTLYVSRKQFEEVGRRALAAIASGTAFEEELPMRRKGGAEFWARLRGRAIDATEPHEGSIWIVEDITHRKAAEESLRLAATVFESTADGVMITDADGLILAVNGTFCAITGYTEAEAIGRSPAMLRSGRHDDSFYDTMWTEIRGQGSWTGEVWNRRKNGEIYPELLTITAVRREDNAITNFVGTFADVTQRKAAEESIRRLAFSDPLTGLPNRRLLLDRLQHALATSPRNRRHGALFFIDLDDFKDLNDTLGHEKGDQLLQQVAARLLGCVREGDTVARLGGDEFVVMLENLDEKLLEASSQADAVGEKILGALNRPYLLGESQHHSTASIGITLFDGRHDSVDELLKQADLAMYQAKESGRNTLRFFDPEMQTVVAARVAMEADLRLGLARSQFVVYYQPQVDRNGRAIGVEALLRWTHPRRGFVPPGEFIPLAESSGLVVPIGQWVLETVCAQLAAWSRRVELRDLGIAVNVSAQQFRQRDFAVQVLATLERSGVDPHRLKLELTESLLVDDIKDVIAKMSALKAKGVGFALDDFGTGYSSLSYLKRLPLDELKIDQGFVRDVLTDPNDAAIAKMIVALAGTMGLDVIAEGVETEAQREFLEQNGCNAYQGYLFSRPLPVQDLEAFLVRV